MRPSGGSGNRAKSSIPRNCFGQWFENGPEYSKRVGAEGNEREGSKEKEGHGRTFRYRDGKGFWVTEIEDRRGLRTIERERRACVLCDTYDGNFFWIKQFRPKFCVWIKHFFCVKPETCSNFILFYFFV